MDADAAVLYGEPAEELVRASFSADLIVAGSRGYGPLHALIAGAVSGRLIRAAACPVIVVPRTARMRAGDGGAAALADHGTLARTFGPVTALDGLSFAVPPGKLFGFVGRNGAGKTTTMRIVCGLPAPDSGTVIWRGRSIDSAARERIGYMPVERGLYPKMRAGDQLEYFAVLHGRTHAQARSAAKAWLERLGLGDRANAKVEELSQGNRQRVQLAAALVHRPDLLVLDEPFAGLDPIVTDLLTGVLREEAFLDKRSRASCSTRSPRARCARARRAHSSRSRSMTSSWAAACAHRRDQQGDPLDLATRSAAVRHRR